MIPFLIISLACVVPFLGCISVVGWRWHAKRQRMRDASVARVLGP